MVVIFNSVAGEIDQRDVAYDDTSSRSPVRESGDHNVLISQSVAAGRGVGGSHTDAKWTRRVKSCRDARTIYD